jgi:hypothetical protein
VACCIIFEINIYNFRGKYVERKELTEKQTTWVNELRTNGYTMGPEDRSVALAMFGLELRKSPRDLQVIQPELFQGVREYSFESLYLVNTHGPYVVDVLNNPWLMDAFERLMKPDPIPVPPDEWVRRFKDFRDVYIVQHKQGNDSRDGYV